MIHFLHLIKFSTAPLLLATPLMLLAIDKNVIRDKGRPRITSLIQRGVGAGVEALTLSFLQRNKLCSNHSDKVHFIKVAPVLRCRPQVYKQI